MDYEEMKNVMNRVIQSFRLDQCNMCKISASQNEGEFVYFPLSDNIIKIWQCRSCLDRKDDDS